MVAEQWSWKHPGELQQEEGLIPEHWGTLNNSWSNKGQQPNTPPLQRQGKETDTTTKRTGRGLDPNYTVWGTLNNKDGNGIWDRIANSRRSTSRSPSINIQAEVETSNIRRKLCNIWGMEVQVLSVHGPTRQHLSTTAVKSRTSSNSAHRCRAAWCSNNRGRREMDTTV